MSNLQLNNLVKMLDQIIANNRHHGDDNTVADIAADHLQKFWARSMKQQIIAHAHDNPTALSALARAAILKLETLSDAPV